MKVESAPVVSRVRRLASTIYDAQAGGRTPLLDGPWWLGIVAGIALLVLVLGSRPWTWLVLPVLVAVLWLPFCVRLLVALKRSVTAFRDELRS